MKKKVFLTFLWSLAFVAVSIAQVRVSGTVTEGDGSGLSGASVREAGTNNGTATDIDGRFSLTVKPGATLQISMVGFDQKDIAIGTSTTFNVKMAESGLLNEVTVTALGVERQSKTLTYATQTVSGDELSRVRDANVINGLAGKAAGVVIQRSASGAGGSTKVVLRGNKSIAGNNNVLYVIDGIPMNDARGAQPGDVWGQSGGSGTAGSDGGDGIGNLNPDDIESINVLKGASAAALYGVSAANGVVLIKTKRGKAGATRVDFTSNFTTEKPLTTPDMQYKYGISAPGSANSWGAAVSAPDHVTGFFNNGSSWTNGISMSGGNETAQTYFSYGNTNANGILPTNEFNRHNLTLRETARFFDNKVSVDASVNYVNQKIDNRPSAGLYFNPLTGLYMMPRGLDFGDFTDNYEIPRASRNVMGQNWIYNDDKAVGDGEDLQQNPYWILNRAKREETRNRFITSMTARWDINNMVYLQARGTADRTADSYNMKAHATTQSTLADLNGRYIGSDVGSNLHYGDVILGVSPKLGPVGLNAILGTSINDVQVNAFGFDSKNGGLRFANEFSLQNMLPGGSFSESHTRVQTQSVFASLAFDLGKGLYLDATGRNDWASPLAGTENKSFFYPSAGLSWVIGDAVSLPANVNFAKIRASWAQVGNTIPGGFSTNPLNLVTFSGGLNFNNVAPFTDLKPEQSTSIEVGTEWRLFNNRASIDFTAYKTNTKNQFFQLAASAGTSYKFFYVNAGDVENKGIEVTLGLTPVKSDKLTWWTGFNISTNRNKIISLHPDLKGEYDISGAGVNNYALKVKEGGSFGDIYGKLIKRDASGAIVVDVDGKPVANAPGLEYVGNPNPKALVGWNNTLTFGKITVGALIDARFGGKVMSITEAMLDERGVSKRSADARDAGGLDIRAVLEDGTPFTGKINAENYYTRIGGRAGYTGEYMYDATNIRLRELTVGYSFGKCGPFKNLGVSLVGRNLGFLMKKAPFDPEISMSTGNGLQGVDVFGLPAVRSLGLNLKVGF